VPSLSDEARGEALFAAEARALALLDAIEARGLIAPGRGERAIEDDIYALAEAEYGVERHWHDRLVRAGLNTLGTAGDTLPERVVAADDMVFVDLGPAFAEWEADVGRSYAIGDDPAKHALCAELPRQFDAMQAMVAADPDITGAALYALACRSAENAGWLFGGKIAGHIVGEFGHRDWPGNRQHGRIAPANPTRLRDPDPFGRRRFWIGEIHLVAPDRSFGGFYERLLRIGDRSTDRIS
jgi:Xaa-Pro dipeptidase